MPILRCRISSAAWLALRGLALPLAVLGLTLVAVQTEVLEDLFLYFPDHRLEGHPGGVGLPFDEISFAASDGVKLHGWFVPGPRPTTLLWLHGNAGNISHRVDQLRLLHDYVGASILLFDYRGYGRSEGRPSEGHQYTRRKFPAMMSQRRTGHGP